MNVWIHASYTYLVVISTIVALIVLVIILGLGIWIRDRLAARRERRRQVKLRGGR